MILQVRDSDNVVVASYPTLADADGKDLTGCTLVDDATLGGTNFDTNNNYVVSGGVLELDLVKVQDNKWAEVKLGWETRDYADLTNSMGTYQGSEESQKRLFKAAWRAMNNQGSWPINWTMADNTSVSHSQAEIIATSGDFAGRSLGLHDAAQVIRSNIYAESDPDVVLAMDVDTLFAAQGY